MTGDQKFLLHELSPPTFFPLLSHFFPVLPETCCTSTHKNWYTFSFIGAHTRHTFLLYFPDIHAHPYTPFTHIHCCSLPGSLKECTKHAHPDGYHQAFPTTTRANHICKLGYVCAALHSSLIPLISKRQFWVLFISQKKERRKYIKLQAQTQSWVAMPEQNCKKWHRCTLRSKKM